MSLLRIDPLRLLQEEIERWMGEQPRQLPEAPQFDAFVALTEGFDRLLAEVTWVRREHFPEDVSEVAFEAMVVLLALASAAARSAPHAFAAGRVPAPARTSFLRLWESGIPRRSEVTAPHVAAAYLSGLWAPPRQALVELSWEPARFLLQAMACKIVAHGLHELAGRGLPPLAEERREQRDVFNQRVVGAAQTAIVLLVTGEAGKTLADWDCERLTLWAFLADAILGPGRQLDPHRFEDALALARRPQPGAFHKCCLGWWAERELGVTVGRREVYLCTACVREHPEPTCPQSADAMVVHTFRDHMFVTPQDRLSDSAGMVGWVQVQRSVCKNPACVARLGALPVATQAAQPIYTLGLEPCPYCHERGRAGQRPITVWTRFP